MKKFLLLILLALFAGKMSFATVSSHVRPLRQSTLTLGCPYQVLNSTDNPADPFHPFEYACYTYHTVTDNNTQDTNGQEIYTTEVVPSSHSNGASITACQIRVYYNDDEDQIYDEQDADPNDTTFEFPLLNGNWNQITVAYDVTYDDSTHELISVIYEF